MLVGESKLFENALSGDERTEDSPVDVKLGPVVMEGQRHEHVAHEQRPEIHVASTVSVDKARCRHAPGQRDVTHVERGKHSHALDADNQLGDPPSFVASRLSLALKGGGSSGSSSGSSSALGGSERGGLPQRQRRHGQSHDDRRGRGRKLTILACVWGGCPYLEKGAGAD